MACGLSNCGFQAREHRLSSSCVQAYLAQGMWDLPGPGTEPVSPASAGRFLATEPPGKPELLILNPIFYSGIDDYHPTSLTQHTHKTNTEYQSVSVSKNTCPQTQYCWDTERSWAVGSTVQ